MRKRDGSTLTYQYDALDRVSAKIVPERSDLDPAQTRDVHYSYDNRGLQTVAAFGAPGNDFVRIWYDGFGQPATVLSHMSGQARYINHNYDRDGNREHLTFTNDGARFRFYYDGLGRMSAVHDRAEHSSADDLVVRYWHRAEGPRHVALFGSGPAGLTTGYYYDNVQRLAAIANDLPGPDASIGLAYNPAGQIVRRDLSNDAFAWSEASGGSLSYKANGLNQYDEVGPNRYSYDANGNLIGDGLTTFTYDVENRLVAASNGARLVYDPLGRLAETSSPNSGTTRFQYDGDKLIAEYDGSNTLLRRYVHGPGTDEPIAVYEGPALSVANRRYLLADERGSIMALAGTDGALPSINTYDEWGFPGRNNKGRFQYTGQTYIPELGLYYYKARFYSPILGRFLQVDPVGYEDGLNIYAYVGNDPVNNRDPSGLFQIGSCAADARGQVSASCSGMSILSAMVGSKSGPVVGIRRIKSRGGQLVNRMIRDPDVRKAMNDAWKRSSGDSRSTRDKNEWGFWVRRVGKDFIAGRLVAGEGPNIYRNNIQKAHEEMSDAQIFFHVHPFRTGELRNVESIDISEADRGIGFSYRSMVISAARPEPYTGRNVWIDYTDDFYEPPGR